MAGAFRDGTLGAEFATPEGTLHGVLSREGPCTGGLVVGGALRRLSAECG